MLENWKTYKLGEVALLKRGYDLPASLRQRGEYQIISSAGVTDTHIDYKVEGPGVVTGRYGTIGKVFYTDLNFWPLNTSLYVKDFNGNDPKFVYYLLHTINWQAYSTKSAVPGIDRNEVHQENVCIPLLPEQRTIASILSIIDDKIELNLHMNRTLEEMVRALYKHWFVDYGPFQDGEFVDSELGMIPKGWEVNRLDSLITFSNGYAFSSKQLLDNEEEDCLHVFKMGHIRKGGGLKSNGTKSWIRKSDCIGLDKYILKVGDILMSMTDMKDNMTILGHTALMNENHKYIVNQRVGLLRIKNNVNIGYPFIFMLTNSFDFIERLRSQANSGVQVNLSTDAIKSSKVITPAKLVNKEFHEIALPLFEQINQNAIENQTLTTLRDTLLPKLISGEVRVNEAAEILVEAL